MNQFKALGLDQPLLDAISELGFTEPTPIQAQAIPYLLNEEGDLIALAQTGTGKTAAFGLPMLQRIDTAARHTQALVIAPTRELCVQIAEELRRFAAGYPRMRMAVVYGGADIRKQMKEVAVGAQLIVATPGRLRDLIERKAVQLNLVDILVLDEADEMLNMGFKEEIDDILQHTPPTKRTWLFSATMPPGVRRIAQEYMDNPRELSVGESKGGNPDIDHRYVIVKPDERYPVLRRFLDHDPSTFGLIFCRTRQETQDLADQLSKDGYDADALHGDLNQTQRDRVMQRFRARRLRLLVATDVAARGIDVQDITHVFHLNIPDDWAFYTHRSGRTGRAGSKGVSLIIARVRDRNLLQQLDQRLRLDLTEAAIPTDREIVTQRMLARFHTLLAAEPPAALAPILPTIEAELEHLSKSDIIARLATLAGQQLLKRYPYIQDERPRPSARLERPERPTKARASAPDQRPSAPDQRPSYSDAPRPPAADLRPPTPREYRSPASGQDLTRLFINVGKMELHSPSEFLQFLQQYGDVPQESVGEVEIHPRHTFFYVEKNLAKRLIQRFAKAELHGRPLRVNPDSPVRRAEGKPSAKPVKKKNLKAGKATRGKRPF